MAKSVTVKIGGDTKEFIDSLKKADRAISTTQKTADNLSKSLKFEYSDTKFTQAQKKYQAALNQTEEKAQSLREKLSELEASGKIDTVDYSTLELELAKTEAKATDLKTKLEDLSKVKVEQLSKKFEDVGQKITSAGKAAAPFSVFAGGAAAGAVALSKSSAALGAEIDDLSVRFGVSSEKIQEWRYLAVQCGVEQDTFTKSLIRMRAAMADLSSGTSNNATNALEAIGITPNQFKTQEEMFDGIVDALARVEDSTLQTAYANEIFGDKIATQMLPYINAGAETIKKFKDEFAAMPSLSNEQVSALAELDDTYYRLSESVKYASAQFGVALEPVMERGVELIEKTVIPSIQKLSAWFDGLSPTMQNVLLGGLAIIALVSPALLMIGKMASGISYLIKLLSLLHRAQLLTAAGFVAIAGAAALGIDLIANWKNMSTVEKILKTLAVAALVAAAAVTVFHASWSMGLAIGAIAAAVAAGFAMINAVKDKILPEEEEFSADNIEDKTTFNPDNYVIPEPTGGGNSYSDYSQSNAQINVTVNVTEPGASAEEIADVVSKKVATIVQARR